MKNPDTLKDIVVIYHDQCRDGLGAAYAAWKKFGDEAGLLPRFYHHWCVWFCGEPDEAVQAKDEAEMTPFDHDDLHQRIAERAQSVAWDADVPALITEALNRRAP